MPCIIHAAMFVEWFLYTIPIVLILLIATAILIAILVRKTNINIKAAHAQLSLHHTTLGKLSSREIYTILILGFTVLMWIVYGTSMGLDVIAFIGVLLAFAFKIAKWPEVEHDVQWSIFIMYGSAIALSAALRDTGAAHSLMLLILQWSAQSPWIILILLILLAAVLTEAMSNAAAVAVLMPIGLELAREFHIDPRIITVALATSAGLTFMLPVSTPAMAMITSCDYVDEKKVLRLGLLFKIIGFITLIGAIVLYWPHLGLHL